ncbi:MAG TPA: pyridoxal phosphate-dependent aminotransferase [Alcaligenaceae bacterium]|nr:pyridoxal phosphate-dependent aminotransferase [Alcaligenaceae bacterium]
MPRLATRTELAVPFHAVELFKEANALIAQGKDIISLGIGEPDFTAPPSVVEALHRAAAAGQAQYTPPSGTDALKEALCHYYKNHFNADVDPDQIMVTAGASGALSLATLALINHGDEVLLPDPSYPANQNFILAAGGVPRLIPSTPEKRYQLTAEDVEKHWTDKTRGVLIASPSNPTGATIDPEDLKALIKAVKARNGFIIMDEIYLGLYYEDKPQSALCLDPNLIIINSFSKYFHMTGWRLGWMILPKHIRPAVEKIAASLAICAPALAQHAALACFEPEAMEIYEQRRLAFKARRDFLLPAFESLGLHVPVKPDGAFYIYADITQHSNDSDDFSHRLLHEALVAAVPGLDFGPAYAKQMVRFSYATSLERLEQAVERMHKFLS